MHYAVRSALTAVKSRAVGPVHRVKILPVYAGNVESLIQLQEINEPLSARFQGINTRNAKISTPLCENNTIVWYN
jgi:hypothetical protein